MNSRTTAAVIVRAKTFGCGGGDGRDSAVWIAPTPRWVTGTGGGRSFFSSPIVSRQPVAVPGRHSLAGAAYIPALWSDKYLPVGCSSPPLVSRSPLVKRLGSARRPATERLQKGSDLLSGPRLVSFPSPFEQVCIQIAIHCCSEILSPPRRPTDGCITPSRTTPASCPATVRRAPPQNAPKRHAKPVQTNACIGPAIKKGLQPLFPPLHTSSLPPATRHYSCLQF
ncbi:hypothetical protein IF1G_06216 [Cordyceps javanica]|uniref:Uncharacterized protein n=1 Tax=Cordyceps javanica TaxID=43265 RepID=A0A545V0M0_9HYPO|nr:hypothetical protein IF1G_06216 [Cordyceps javanica]